MPREFAIGTHREMRAAHRAERSRVETRVARVGLGQRQAHRRYTTALVVYVGLAHRSDKALRALLGAEDYIALLLAGDRVNLAVVRGDGRSIRQGGVAHCFSVRTKLKAPFSTLNEHTYRPVSSTSLTGIETLLPSRRRNAISNWSLRSSITSACSPAPAALAASVPFPISLHSKLPPDGGFDGARKRFGAVGLVVGQLAAAEVPRHHALKLVEAQRRGAGRFGEGGDQRVARRLSRGAVAPFANHTRLGVHTCPVLGVSLEVGSDHRVGHGHYRMRLGRLGEGGAQPVYEIPALVSVARPSGRQRGRSLRERLQDALHQRAVIFNQRALRSRA